MPDATALHVAMVNVNEALFDRPLGDDATVLRQLGARVGRLSVIVLTSTPRQPVDLTPNVRLVPVHAPSRLRAVPSLRRTLAACHREHPIDLVQAQEAPFTGLIAWTVSRRIGSRLIVGVFGSDPGDRGFRRASPGHRVASPVAAFVLRRADAVQTDSRVTETRLSERGLPAHYKPMTPANLTDFLHAGARRSYAPQATRVLFVGRLGRQKRIALLLEAFAVLRLQRDDVRLTIVGDGPDRAAIEDWIGERELGGDVELRGQVTHAALPDVYLEADVLAMSSHYEGMPRAFLEAGATGLPIVSTLVSGAQELARDAPLWLLPDDAEGYAAGLASALDDLDRRRSCGELLHAAVERRLGDPEPPEWQVSIWCEVCASGV